MTKEELLAMPAADYMNDVQLAFFRNLLQTRLEELHVHYRDGKVQLESLENAADPADQAGVEEQRLFLGRSLQRDAAAIQEVKVALNDMESSYGFSVLTGEPIGLERLLVCPTAMYTVDEQNRRERHQLHLARTA
ncbi:TPA: TraR/DksA family transcriptional regulator [Pseudomonas aeruginosa]|jgi:DnaK suppressor protein|uniref:TraR/DksA family transcriptional regulator n=1 Tax=Pseudomonas aeruginosa TaxID=287 RepID=UPI00093E88BD|nr:TraR/DksA family transcriptional regulator [Pseudomonas aeruginosa]EKF7417578.1 TraR/DksA family transcriptional regulator [Pseudomonas aeruginosa]MDS9914861.1 TraR/DksA family transcriptional regulator [Pseudomonas aeruginosa]HBO1619140.1 TraR/DksA family transcriptional regulator [Pseudomonas aeruginosa]HCA5864523.1 TraR/DksA family transcriptional regulator [Pseudomonas aeruginosa]HCA7378165.1 TraR/DksA family transcriptional regulator [Pseudomonas aeruginosa]